MTDLREQALTFRELHIPGRPLVLANAWDTVSARVVEEAGAPAVATTSAGLSWDLGAADGDRLDRDRALEAASEARWGSPRTESGGASRLPSGCR